MTRADAEGGAPVAPTADGVFRLVDLVKPERIRVPLNGQDKASILAELVDLVARSEGREGEREAIYRAVLEREGVLSTGVGDGIALPHAKYEGLDGMVMAAGVSRNPVDYGSLDGKPVRLFFLLIAPESAAGAHVRALSRLSRVMRDPALRSRLIEASDEVAFFRVLGEAEHAAH
jgi:PTS system nitrogen regulatory IIA component